MSVKSDKILDKLNDYNEMTGLELKADCVSYYGGWVLYNAPKSQDFYVKTRMNSDKFYAYLCGLCDGCWARTYSGKELPKLTTDTE